MTALKSIQTFVIRTSMTAFDHNYHSAKSKGYSLGVVSVSVRPSIPSDRPSAHTFCLSGTITQCLLVRFDSFLVQMTRTMDSQYPISLVKINPLILVSIDLARDNCSITVPKVLITVNTILL